MLHKRYMMIVGLSVLVISFAGCGKKAATVTENEVTPTAEALDITPTAAADLLDMDETTEEKNVIGNKTTTASKVTIVNRTGEDIAALYIREHPSDDEEEDAEWGDDLINGAFTLKNTENAVYYYEKPATGSTAGVTATPTPTPGEDSESDTATSTVSASKTYDIRITYTDEDRNECFFRDLPLTNMKTITLRMNGSGDDSFPYATYTVEGSSKEYSTINAVKKRLGLTTDDEDEDEENDSDSESTPTPTPSSSDSKDPTSTPAAKATSTPQPEDPEPVIPSVTDSPAKGTAEDYIGLSWDDLQSAIGSAEMEEYNSDEDQGTTGYHYYSDFTVSTSVDDDGYEIVTGVW